MIHTKRFGEVVGIGLALGLILAGVFWLATAFAGTGESARGFAWGGGVTSNPSGYDGMGWISMNNLTGGGGPYGVNIPGGNGNVTGHAWSEHYGWISFNGSDLAGCSPALAQARRTGNTLTGGARIIAIRDEGTTNRGGYDGCISLNGVTVSNGTMGGYAWSSDLGWIDFTGVTVLTPPENLTATPNAACGSGQIALSWNPVANATRYTLRDGATNIYSNSGTSFTHTGLTNGSAHNYTVRAEIGGQNSEWSSVVTAVAPSACGAPSGSMSKTPSCEIAIGAGSCVIPNITWNVNNPGTPALRQNTVTPVTLSTNPGVPVNSGPITFGTQAENTISVTDGGVTLDFYTPEGVCAADSYWNGTICTQPNLVPQTFTVNGVAYNTVSATFTQGTAIPLAGTVRNTGSVPTNKNFSDAFEYKWGAAGAWTPVVSVPHASLANGATAPDAGTFTPNQGGQLFLKYCVDSGNDIAEGAEDGAAKNCVETPSPITVNPVFPNLTVVSFTINGTPYNGSVSTLTQGTPVNLVGRVRNAGPIAVPNAFTNNFTYSVDGGATWLPVAGNSTSDTHFENSKNYSEYIAGMPANSVNFTDTNTFTPSQGGTVRLQYCVDSGVGNGSVDEGPTGENGNCVQSGSITVNSSSVSCDPATISGCMLQSANVGETVNGSCDAGFSGGGCQARCDLISGSGQWSMISNACTPDSSGPSSGPSSASTGNIYANPSDISSGQTSVITWETEDTTSCQVTGDPSGPWTGTDNMSPGETTAPLNSGSRTYILECDNVPLDSVTITVRGPEINASPLIVPTGGSTNITWNTRGVLGCTINGGSLNNFAVDGQSSPQSVVINGFTVFTLRCPDGSGNLSPVDTVRVDIDSRRRET